MITDRQLEPRCASCGTIIVRFGTSCATCDTEAHFEGASRTAPDVATQSMRGSHTLRRTSHPG
jgi:hypothetical protein